MTVSRRKALAIIGGGSVLAAGSGAGAFLATRTPTEALKPWALAGTYDELRRRALSYAILAPNPHNLQPWLVDLSQEGRITLFVDTAKDLPETDPFDRQITIGLGCFLEILRMAAAQDGYRADITPFPEGYDDLTLDARPVATVDMIRDASVVRDTLFTHVLMRSSLKASYDTAQPVSSKTLDHLKSVVDPAIFVGSNNQTELRNGLRDLTYAAMETELTTPAPYKESVDLFRIGKAEINANPDGLELGGPMIDTMAKLGLFSRKIAMDPDHFTYQMAIEGTLAPFRAAMAHIWLVTEGNTRLDQLAAGRAYVRINLAATAQGVGIHPHSQALQEYPEMRSLYAQAHDLLAPEGGRVQMLAALGYADPVSKTPRWPIEAKILES